MKRIFLIWFLFWSRSVLLWSQELPNIERLLERNHIEESEGGYEDMIQVLQELLVHPLNINTASFDSLQKIFFLSDSQIDHILAFRKKYGVFLHLNELLLVTGVNRKDLENIIPFITLGEVALKDRMSALKKQTKQEIIAKARTTFPEQEGYKKYRREDFAKEQDYLKKVDNRFHGLPVGTLLKYKIISDRLQAGVTLENDPGEAYFTRYQKTGFDFFSAHVSIATDRLVRRLILGDYKLQWGQGLVAWNGFSSGKSAAVVGNEKSGNGISPYTSTDENNFLRGIALSLGVRWGVTADLFVSSKKMDANLLQNDTISDDDVVTASLYQSGYHRNNLECWKKHTLDELTTGMSMRWNTLHFKVGINTLYYHFTPPIESGHLLYQQYNDNGTHRYLVSVDYKTGYRGVYLFGETAVSDNRSVATVDGVRFSLSVFSVSMLYRRYDKRYTSLYSGGFGEYSNTSNEEGFYIGVEVVPVKNLKLNTYYDWFRFFSPRYRASLPASGREGLVELSYLHGRFEHLFYVKHEEKPEDAGPERSVPRIKQDFRYQLSCVCSKQLELRTRCSFSQYRKTETKEYGYMVYQDLIYATRKDRFKMQFRLVWFDIDSYNARIYAYENNVLYGYSFPAFMNRGWRTYLNGYWKPSARITYYLKSGFSIYPDRKTLSSGLTQVNSNRTIDLTFQVRMTF